MKIPFKRLLNPIDQYLQAHLGRNYLIGRNIVKNKIKYAKLHKIRLIEWQTAPLANIHWQYDIPITLDQALITAIVFFDGNISILKHQLNCIQCQTYKNIEILVLADYSQKALLSKEINILNNIISFQPVFFEGLLHWSLFERWNKAILVAHGQYMWILDSENIGIPNFLDESLKCMSYQSVMVTFCMDKGSKRIQKPFSLVSAPVFIKRVLSEKIISIPSGCVMFRNPCTEIEELYEYSALLKGDQQSQSWIFYLWLIRGGCVGYTAASGCPNIMASDSFILATHQQILKEFVAKYYFANKRVTHILMCCSDFMIGGGETFALHLANELYHQGFTVTVIDFHMYQFDINVRRILTPAIPVVKLRALCDLANVINQLEGDIIHSHHGNVDEAVSIVLQKVKLNCNQYITLHGMYEAMPEVDCRYLLKQISKTCSGLAYIADKNLEPFKSYNCRLNMNCFRIDNGLPNIDTVPIDRSSLDIPQTAFVLCLASRGIREKGWEEGIKIVSQARECCKRDIHLVILGDGEMRALLEPEAPYFIHFMGTVSNVREYFAMSDAGFLPSYFKGESFPLVVIEALMSGIPIIASDLGEIKYQLSDEDGKLAGALIPLCNWALNIEAAVKIVSTWADHHYEYQKYRQRVCSAAQKFDIQKVTAKYVRLYRTKGVISKYE